MHYFSSVLVPVDGSASSEAALDVACSVARESKGHVRVLHVCEPHVYLAGRRVHTGPEPVAERRDEEALLQRAAEHARSYGLDVDVELAEGDPVDEILAAAERIGADTIVVGSRGTGGFARLVLGSVAERLMERSPRPVLVVRRPTIPAEHAASPKSHRGPGDHPSTGSARAAGPG